MKLIENHHRDHDDPYSRDWVIEKAYVGLELCELPLPTGSGRQKVSLERDAAASSEDDALYQLVWNSFRTEFRITGKNR